jgi:hypothetical protein
VEINTFFESERPCFSGSHANPVHHRTSECGLQANFKNREVRKYVQPTHCMNRESASDSGKSRNFSFLQRSQVADRLSGPGYRGPFCGIEAARTASEPLASSSAEVTKERSYTSYVLYIFMAFCLMEHKNKVALLLYVSSKFWRVNSYGLKFSSSCILTHNIL